MDLTDADYDALEAHARGLGNTVNHATRTRLHKLDLIEHGQPDGWPYWHLTPAGWRALSDNTDPNEPDDYRDEQADRWRDDR